MNEMAEVVLTNRNLFFTFADPQRITAPSGPHEFAAVCNFIHLQRNRYDDPRLKEEQKQSILASYKIDRFKNGFPTHCSCQLFGQLRCVTSNCKNRGIGVSCAPDCAMCANNWFTRLEHMAVTSWRLEVKWVRGQVGVFAYVDLPRHTVLGEFTGVVEDGSRDYTDKERIYTYRIRETGHVINATKEGSFVRHIAHSCNPNSEAVLWVYRYEYRVIYRTTRDVVAGEELTAKQDWKFKDVISLQACACQGVNVCNTMIGELETPVDDEEPVVFDNVASNASAQQWTTLLTPIRPSLVARSQPETHLFNPLDEVTAICTENAQLRVTAVRVLECIKSVGGIYMYRVLRVKGGVGELYLPRFMLFHQEAYAQAALKSVFDEQDKIRMRSYLLQEQVFTAAMLVRNEIAINYAARFFKRNVPEAEVERTKYPGGTALGLAEERVIFPSSDNEEDDDIAENLDNSPRASPAAAPTPCSSPPIPDPEDDEDSDSIAARVKMRSRKREMRTHREPRNLTRPDQVETTTLDDNGPERARLISVGARPSDGPIPDNQPDDQEYMDFESELYDPYPSENILKISKRYTNRLFLRRQLNHASECVTLFALARLAQMPNMTMDYEELFRKVRKDLYHYYFEVPYTAHRRFLLYSHYRVALEIQKRGSVYLRWCSLCKKKETFATKAQLNHHFHKCHMICSALYCCSNVRKHPGRRMTTNLPSVMRWHILRCIPRSAAKVSTSVDPWVLDAYADYVALRTSNNHFRHLITPGIPAFYELDGPLAIWRPRFSKYFSDEDSPDDDDDGDDSPGAGGGVATANVTQTNAAVERNDDGNESPEDPDWTSTDDGDINSNSTQTDASVPSSTNLNAPFLPGQKKLRKLKTNPKYPRKVRTDQLEMNPVTGIPIGKTAADVHETLFRIQKTYKVLERNQPLNYEKKPRFVPDLEKNYFLHKSKGPHNRSNRKSNKSSRARGADDESQGSSSHHDSDGGSGSATTKGKRKSSSNSTGSCKKTQTPRVLMGPPRTPPPKKSAGRSPVKPCSSLQQEVFEESDSGESFPPQDELDTAGSSGTEYVPSSDEGECTRTTTPTKKQTKKKSDRDTTEDETSDACTDIVNRDDVPTRKSPRKSTQESSSSSRKREQETQKKTPTTSPRNKGHHSTQKPCSSSQRQDTSDTSDSEPVVKPKSPEKKPASKSKSRSTTPQTTPERTKQLSSEPPIPPPRKNRGKKAQTQSCENLVEEIPPTPPPRARERTTTLGLDLADNDPSPLRRHQSSRTSGRFDRGTMQRKKKKDEPATVEEEVVEEPPPHLNLLTSGVRTRTQRKKDEQGRKERDKDWEDNSDKEQ